MVIGIVILLGFSLPDTRSMVVGGVVLFWSIRLASHIFFDRLREEKPEDGRYQHLRAWWGDRANARFFWFFQAQALLVPLFLLPPAAVMLRPDPFPTGFDLAGLFVAIGAIGAESMADRQLARFRRNPENKGRVCREGLWRYSRHPNYFFEWVHWLGYVFWSAGHPFAWAGAGLMFLFLRYFTGIPHTERQSLASRGDAYREYQNTTSVFLPWIPRKPS